jgi:hypothetical protein
MGVKFAPKMSKTGYKKSRRFVIFRRPFWSILSLFGPIGIYRKTGPTKSTVLGARPPPWKFYKIYRFLPFFWVLGAFNRAGKSVSKIGIYALPPQKSEIYAFFIISRPNFNDGLNLSLPRQFVITIESPRRNIFNYTTGTVFLISIEDLVRFIVLFESKRTNLNTSEKRANCRDNS